jgi:hypothetical protein
MSHNDYHDTRAKILLEAAKHLTTYAKEHSGPVIHFVNFSNDAVSGIIEAAAELRRMASVARREHGKVLDRKRRAGRKVNPELVGV